MHSLIYDIMNDKQRADYEEFLKPTFRLKFPMWRVFVSMPLTKTGAQVRYFVPFHLRS